MIKLKPNLRRYQALILLVCLVNACVTINVYFPAAAAQEAADRIINKVYGNDTTPPSSTPPTAPPTTSQINPESSNQSTTVWLMPIADFFITPALAQANLDISTPTIQTLTANMTARHQKLLPHYNSGALGLTNDALITLRDPNQVPLKLRNEIKSLVAQENQDRLKLYREIAVANAHPEWEANIRATFAKRWIDRATAGWWYQNANGDWQPR